METHVELRTFLSIDLSTAAGYTWFGFHTYDPGPHRMVCRVVCFLLQSEIGNKPVAAGPGRKIQQRNWSRMCLFLPQITEVFNLWATICSPSLTAANAAAHVSLCVSAIDLTLFSNILGSLSQRHAVTTIWFQERKVSAELVSNQLTCHLVWLVLIYQ